MPLKKRKIIIAGLTASLGSRVNWMTSFLPQPDGEYCLPEGFEPQTFEWMKAILLATDQKPNQAVECWKRLKSISNHNFFSLLAAKGLVSHAIADEDFGSLAREVVDSFVDNENYLIGTIGRAVEDVLKNKHKVKASTNPSRTWENACHRRRGA